MLRSGGRQPDEPRVEASSAGLTEWRGIMSAASWWQVMMLVAGALILALGTVLVTQILIRPLTLLFLAIVIAEALEPLVVRLQKWVPRTVSVILVYLMLVIASVGVGAAMLPPLLDQAQTVVERAPEIASIAQSSIAQWDRLTGGQFGENVISQFARVGEALTSLPLTILSSTIEIGVVIVMSLYWLIMAPTLHDFVLSLLPEGRREEADMVLREIGQNMGGYVRGLMIDGIIMAAIAYVGLLIISVRYHVVLALIAGIGGLIPIVGSTVAGAAMVGVALTQSFAKAILTFFFYLGLQFFESNVLFPNIIHRQAYISPFVVIFALFTGGAVGGILGALVSIPLVSALRVIILRVIAPAVRRWSGAAEMSEEQVQIEDRRDEHGEGESE